MRILEIEIDNYKILKNTVLKLNNKQVFPKGTQVLGLIGVNGSGKTTFCSIIARIFQSIFTRTKLNFDIKIKFEYDNSIRIIDLKDYHVQLFIDNNPYYEFNLGERFNRLRSETHNDKICNFWNGKIVLSTFETNTEYPNKKPYNYIGNDPLVKYDLAGLYSKNGFYGYPSITRGIIRFLENKSKQNIAQIFLEQMGFQLSGKIDLKIVSNLIEYRDTFSEEYQTWSSSEFINSRHYSPEKVKKAERVRLEEALYRKIAQDSILELIPETQSINFSDALRIINDYGNNIGKYIFLNGLGLIKDGKELGFNNLSSGEKFLIIRYLSILSGIEENSVVIIEEPENHLNPKWKELIIPALHKAASEFNSVIIFTTHDYKIIRYLHNNCVLKVSKGSINNMKENTLLCDEFDFESIVEETIPFVYKDLKDTYYSIDQEGKAELLNSMCNVEEKIFLRNEFLNNYEKN